MSHHERFYPPALNRVVEAYRNPRLEDPAADYLNAEHVAELRDLSEIVEWNPGRPKRVNGVGTLHPFTMATKQGYGYAGAIGVPETQRSGTLGIATSPLGISDRGYPRHVMLNYMRAGNYSLFVAGEGSHKPETSLPVRTRISMGSSAAMLLNLSFHVQQELAHDGHDVEEGVRFVYGASRAGGIGLIANALDHEFAQTVVASDIIAPSPLKKHARAEQWQTVAEQVLSEPAKTALIVARLGLRRAFRYRESPSLDPYSLAHQLEICGGLFNGELDAAVQHIPGGKIIRITEYDLDHSCNDGGLERRLAPATHPNVRFEELEGIHMTIIDRDVTLRHMMGFNKAFQEYEVADIKSPDALFARASELAPRQAPLSPGQTENLVDQLAS